MRPNLPGRYRYLAPFLEAEPVIVVVMEDDGELVACFPSGTVVPVSKMPGDFQPLF